MPLCNCLVGNVLQQLQRDRVKRDLSWQGEENTEDGKAEEAA